MAAKSSSHNYISCIFGEIFLREFEIPLCLRQWCLLLPAVGKVPHQLPAHGRGNKGNNRSFCDKIMTFGTVMAKGIPKRCGYGAIMNFQNGRQWQLFSYQFSYQGWIFNEDLISSIYLPYIVPGNCNLNDTFFKMAAMIGMKIELQKSL